MEETEVKLGWTEKFWNMQCGLVSGIKQILFIDLDIFIT